MHLTVDNLERVTGIFAAALELPTAERESYVRVATRGNISLQESVLRLLSKFSELGDFLASPATGIPVTAELRPGMVLAERFRIDTLLGKGGMGEVYRCDDLVLGEVIALKMVRSEWRSDGAMLERFRRELTLARKIAHPNVCRIFELLTAADSEGEPLVFFTMEYLAGEPLSSLLHSRGRLGIDEVLRIGEGIAAGLDAAHSTGIVHGDLKPGNIIMAGDAGDRPTITDFGLAKRVDRPEGAVTQTGVLAGSPDYMSPEQFRGEPLTRAADIYALGMILYEMAAGVRAYPAENLVQAAVRRVIAPPTPLRQVAPDAPVHWTAVLDRALAREPHARPRSAQELIRGLRERPSILTAALGYWRPQPPSRRAFLWTSAAAAVAMASFLSLRRFTGWSGRRPAVLMLTPIVTNNDTATARLLHLQIEQGLLQSGRVRVLAPERIAEAWERTGRRPPVPETLSHEDARMLGRRAGADGIVFGDLAWTGSEWSLKAQLEWIADSYGATDTEHFYAEDRHGLMVAAARAADWLRRSAGEKDPAGRPPEEVTTSNWEALREFMLARDAWRARPSDREWPTDQREQAEAHLERALELDPKFAAAAGLLADIQMSANQFDDAMLTYQLAARLIDERNLTDRESLMIRGLFALDSGQYAKAEEVFSRFTERFPADPLPVFHKARAVECQGNEAGALRLYDLAVQMAPQNFAFLNNRAIRYLFVGQFEQARADCERSGKIIDTDWTDRLRSALAFAAWDLKGVWAPMEHMKRAGSASQRGGALALEACVRAEQNRLAEAQGLLEEALRLDAENNQPAVITIPKMQAMAGLYLRRRQPAGAVEICRRILAGKPGIRLVLETGGLLAQAGDAAGAAACLPEGLPKEPPRAAPAGPPAGAAAQLAWPIYWRRTLRLWAEIAMARGDYAAAFALLQNAPLPEVSQEWPDALVRASIASGEKASAALHLSRLFQNPAAYWISAELSPPGFMRQGIEQARTLDMAGGPWRRLETFLNST